MNRAAGWATGWAAAGVAACAVVATLAVVLGAVGPPGSTVVRPPCDRLPQRTQVESALAEHADLVRALEATGSGVGVRAGRPCADDPDRSLVTVTWSSGAEREAVDRLLTRSDGFGVPVEVVRG